MGLKFIVELKDDRTNGRWLEENLATKNVTVLPEGFVNMSDELFMTTRQTNHLLNILKIFGVDYTIDNFEVSTLPTRHVKINYRFCPMPDCTDNSSNQTMKEE